MYSPAIESYELLREVFKTASAKQVAAETGLSLSMIYKWAEPPETGTGSRVDHEAIHPALPYAGSRRRSGS